jgi:hypothetical protein
VVAEAGVRDIAQGAALLATSEDIGVMSALVRSMGAGDLDAGLAVSRVGGELAAVARLVERLDMPVLAAFLEDRGDLLRDLSVDTLLRYVGARALSSAMAGAGGRVAELGIGEVAEGATRMIAGERLADASDDLAAEGAAQAVLGVAELEVGAEAGAAARAEAVAGVAEMVDGAAKVGAAATMDATAQALEERAK